MPSRLDIGIIQIYKLEDAVKGHVRVLVQPTSTSSNIICSEHQSTMSSSVIAKLPDGYEIRQITREHLDWVRAIVGHTMSFDSPIWSCVPYNDGDTQRAYDMYKAMEASSGLSIDSGLSYGVFIKDWTARDKTTKKGGELRWDFGDKSASREVLLEQMDLPLVAIAMSKDAAAAKPIQPEGVTLWGDIVDGHKDISDGLKAAGREGGDDKLRWLLEGRIARRSGTHTRGDHAGKGLSKALAHFVMQELANKGYDKILIHTGGGTVHKVWSDPPAPFYAITTGEFDTAKFRKLDGQNKQYNPFGNAQVVCTRVWIVLTKNGGPNSSMG